MNLKQILESIISELENIGAVASATEAALFERKLLNPNQIDAHVPSLQKELQRRLQGLRASISELPD